MIQKFLFLSSVMMSVLIVMMFVAKQSNDQEKHIAYDLRTNPIDNMPLVDDCPYTAETHGGRPQEQRETKYNKWISNGIKVGVRSASGSGTIVYYNPDDRWAYVHSCGHLWSGNMTAEEGRRKGRTAKITVWYHNRDKLPDTRTYNADVLYYSNSDGRDISLLRFKPDWEPNYLPIAPADWNYSKGERLHSVGCDGGREVAHYDVETVGLRQGDWPDLVTTRNSPRPGRSGGGLSDESYFVGICWGTSDYSGDGNGYFTPIRTIREYNKRNGYGWLNEVGNSLARQIPIRDRNNPQGRYPKNYIPLPIR
jgi:hypothetical protein